MNPSRPTVRARAPIDRQRQRSGDDARQRAMQAAMSAIAELGADRVRMADIAVRAGMSTGHILYHFGRKDRLLLEVLDWSESDLRDGFRTTVARTRVPSRKLVQFVDAYLPDDQGDQHWSLWAQVLARSSADDASKALLDTLTQSWEDLLTDLITSGVNSSHFHAVDIGEFVVRSRAMLDGLALDVMIGSNKWTAKSAREFAVKAMAKELGAS